MGGSLTGTDTAGAVAVTGGGSGSDGVVVGCVCCRVLSCAVVVFVLRGRLLLPLLLPPLPLLLTATGIAEAVGIRLVAVAVAEEEVVE